MSLPSGDLMSSLASLGMTLTTHTHTHQHTQRAHSSMDTQIKKYYTVSFSGEVFEITHLM